METQNSAMDSKPVPEIGAHKVIPKYRGYFVQRKWYCDCFLEAKCRKVKLEESDYLGKKFWSCPKVEKAERCPMWMLDEDAAKAKDWLAQYGPDTPDFQVFQRPVQIFRPPSPKTPPRKKLGIDINPFSIAKAKPKRPLSRESSVQEQNEGPDNGEGRAPPEEQLNANDAEEEVAPASSEERQNDDSDSPPAKRARYSLTTPLPNAPIKKKQPQVSITTPLCPSRRAEGSFIKRLQAARRDEERQQVQEQPPKSLPTPETGNKTRVLEVKLVRERSENRGLDVMTSSSLIKKLSSPINLPNPEFDTDSSGGYSTPTRRPRTNGSSWSKGKGKDRAASHEIPVNLSTAIMSILQSEGHVLKESTRFQIEHEVGVTLDVKDAKIKRCEQTIAEQRAKLDEQEKLLGFLTAGGEVDRVVVLSD